MTNGNDLVSILQRATKAVERAKVPEDLRAAAYGKAFDYIAGVPGNGGGAAAASSPAPARKGAVTAPSGDLLDKIATRFGVNRERVEDVYEVDGEELRLIVAPGRLDTSNRSGTEQIALLLAAGRQAAELAVTTDSSMIRAVAEDYGKADSNFGKVLTAMGDHFSLKKQEQGQNRDVKVRRTGIVAAGELVTRLTEQQARGE